MAALTELFVMVRRTPEREAAVKIMIYGGAAGAVVAALFGWIHTGPWFGGDTVIQLHRWNGELIAALGTVAERNAFRNSKSAGDFCHKLFPIATLAIASRSIGRGLAHGPKHTQTSKSLAWVSIP